MNKTYFALALLFTFSINFIFSQNFTIPGEVSVDGEFKKGFFSEELNEYTNSLNFKYSDSGEIIDLFNSENIVFKINSKRNLYKTLNVEGYIHPFILIVDGKASFYKDIKSKNFYIQNESRNSKVVKLEPFKSSKKNSRNAGILSLIFEDCISVRSQIEKEDINESTVIQLTNGYNKCPEYADGFQLSNKQKKEQEYLRQPSIYSLDFGGTLAFNNFDSQIPFLQNESTKSNNVGYGAFVSFNVSPTYFNQLRDILYFDISVSYNIAPEFEVEFYDVSRANFLINVSPTYYFLRDRKLNPFARANFGINYTNYELVKNEESIFRDVEGTRKSFIFGIEAGVQFNRQFELALLYQPKSKEKYTIFLNNTFEIDNSIIALKASYIINFSKD
ncbi:porin family protein [Psychroserpens algicola]|uniref:Porin family protein n=1 Tax=Psychroserpens algicola TaxID=1719034 RepID=A0ABT0HB67_9FLAO|nr:porin family protein [Psychroserpens algicola]MCK8481437.1 porin family protein [Psychroserpens algicola]